MTRLRYRDTSAGSRAAGFTTARSGNRAIASTVGGVRCRYRSLTRVGQSRSRCGASTIELPCRLGSLRGVFGHAVSCAHPSRVAGRRYAAWLRGERVLTYE